MPFLEKLLKIVDIIAPTEEQINVDKGREFEQFIAGIFSSQKKYFSVEDFTTDIYNKRLGINVESNKNPDLLIKYKPTNERFAVECKYRSHLIKSKKIDDSVVKWAYPQQINRYKEYSKKNNVPVFIMVGLAGKPSDPEFTFCIPLKELKYPEIFPSLLDKYKRIPANRPFFWKDGLLK